MSVEFADFHTHALGSRYNPLIITLCIILHKQTTHFNKLSFPTMKFITAAITLTTLFGAAQGSSSKSGKGSKSGSCTYCSVDTLTRAQMLTEYTFKTFAGEDDTVIFPADALAKLIDPVFAATYILTVEEIAGCLIKPICFINDILANNEDKNRFDFYSASTLVMCNAEKTGVRAPDNGVDNDCEIIIPSVSPSSSSSPSSFPSSSPTSPI